MTARRCLIHLERAASTDTTVAQVDDATIDYAQPDHDRNPRITKVPMSLFHAVAFVDHHSAQVLQFDSEHVLERKIHEHVHLTRQHASSVRGEHEFFGRVCDAMEGIAEVLVAGRRTGIADFQHYVQEHRPLTAARIVDYEVVDHPTENQLVALARKHFARYDRMLDTAHRPAG